MPAFSNLPYEILGNIISHLPCSDRARIAGLSRRLHDISQPLLYTAPYLPKCPENLDSPVSRPSRQLFLRTLLTPGGATLAAHVRSLRIEWDSTESEHDNDNDCLSDSHTVRCAIASRLNLNYPLRTQGAQLMIIFDLLPQLRVLHLIPPDGISTPSRYSFARFLERSISPGTLPLALHSLLSFHCAHFTFAGISGVSGRTMLMLLKLPNINTIDVPNFTRHKISMFLLHGVAVPSAVKKLRFSSANMPPWALSFILRTSTALTHFSYSTPNGFFDPVGFMKVLVPLRTSLRSLHLDITDACMATVEYQGLDLPYTAGSLRECTALQTLRCGLTPLLGAGPRVDRSRLVDVLPVGLRELVILPDPYWSLAESVAQMEELLRCKVEMPVLERVAVVSFVGGESW